MEETKLLLDRGGKIYENGKVRKGPNAVSPSFSSHWPPALRSPYTCNLAVSCSLHCFQLVDILLVYACQINFKARMPTPLCLVFARSVLPAPVVDLLNSERPCPVH